MRQITILLLLSISISSYSQSKLTQRQIERRNYKEVIGSIMNSKDTIKIDKYAMYPDGIKGIRNHISRNLRYPQSAYRRGIQGKVILKIIVEKDGSIADIEVLQSIDPTLDSEAIRVLSKLKAWVPGYNNGLPVKVEYKIPFYFKI